MKYTAAPGVWLGILLLALLKNASTVPVSSDGVIATLDLGDPYNRSAYSRRVTLAVQQWTDTQQERGTCRGSRSIWYRDRCVILASSQYHCPANHWLVLEKPKESDRNRYFPVKPKCVELPCERPMVWWDPLQKCIYENEEDICGEGKELHTDLFGDVYCDCPSGYGQLFEGGDCLEYYQQSPCKSGQLLVLDVASTLGKCVSCSSEDKLSAADEETTRTDLPATVATITEENKQRIEVAGKMFAPLDGTGPCKKLDLFNYCGSPILESYGYISRQDVSAVSPQIVVSTCQNFDPITNTCPGKVNIQPEQQKAYDEANTESFN